MAGTDCLMYISLNFVVRRGLLAGTNCLMYISLNFVVEGGKFGCNLCALGIIVTLGLGRPKAGRE